MGKRKLKVKILVIGKADIMNKDSLLDIQRKLAEFLKMKEEMQIVNQENYQVHVSLLNLQKRLIKASKKSVRFFILKEHLKRDQLLQQY